MRREAVAAAQARAPELHQWSAAQLGAFLGWSAQNCAHHVAWHVLAYTGMRRGELLALRWRDIDLERGTIAVHRSAGIVRLKGQPDAIRESDTKNKQSRMVDIEPQTAALLRGWKRDRGGLRWPWPRRRAGVR